MISKKNLSKKIYPKIYTIIQIGNLHNKSIYLFMFLKLRRVCFSKKKRWDRSWTNEREEKNRYDKNTV